MSFYDGFPRRQTVAERTKEAQALARKLEKRGRKLSPVAVEGNKIAHSFWGRAWCEHMDSLGDFASRLPRGRSYVRNGSVIHLDIQPGRIEANVVGTSMYDVVIDIKTMPPAKWKKVVAQCAGRVDSVVDLLQGALNDDALKVLTNPKDGMFPRAADIELDCSCPDYATMCKHVAAVLYGVGARLDHAPELLFTLRNVDQRDLIGNVKAVDVSVQGVKTVPDAKLAGIFGIEIETKPPKARKRKR